MGKSWSLLFVVVCCCLLVLLFDKGLDAILGFPDQRLTGGIVLTDQLRQCTGRVTGFLLEVGDDGVVLRRNIVLHIS